MRTRALVISLAISLSASLAACNMYFGDGNSKPPITGLDAPIPTPDGNPGDGIDGGPGGCCPDAAAPDGGGCHGSVDGGIIEPDAWFGSPDGGTGGGDGGIGGPDGGGGGGSGYPDAG